MSLPYHYLPSPHFYSNTLKKQIEMLTSAAGNNSYNETERHTWSSPSNQFLGVVGFLINALCCLLQLKYQTQKPSPFDTNNIIKSFVVVIFVFATMFAAQIIIARVQRRGTSSCGQIFEDMSFFCGALVTILLVLILVPPFGWFLLTLWGVSASVWFLQIGFPFFRRVFAQLDYKTLWDKLLSIICCNGHDSGNQYQPEQV